MPLTCKQILDNAINPGDYVWCNYTATSRSIGTFSNIARYTDAAVSASLMPIQPTSTPNGYFKFILVGYDSSNNKLFIADRPIQSAIAWDDINTSGIASGSGLPITIDSYVGLCTLRLLSGGVSSSDLDNEWDQIIVGSTLGGVITAGDSTVWNPSTVGSWTSTTNTSGSTYRTVRGTSTVSASTGLVSSTYSAVVGFRPVLVVAYQPISLTSLVVNPTHVYKTNSSISVSSSIIPQGYTNIPSNLITFDSTDVNKLAVTPYTQLNGQMSLVQSATAVMTDAGALGTGELFTKTIPITDFTTISKIEVL